MNTSSAEKMVLEANSSALPNTKLLSMCDENTIINQLLKLQDVFNEQKKENEDHQAELCKEEMEIQDLQEKLVKRAKDFLSKNRIFKRNWTNR